MAQILGRFVKQPDEVLDYDVSYDEFFSNRTDTPVSYTVVAETGITIDNDTLSSNTVRITLSGGTAGESYKITVLLTTTTGVVKEADFVVKVKAV